ncbi:recombinase family protein [Latilactobacillus curvatus]|uniref:recombinase family protein n=1 Tax=Latilactobacillus curvatus TaxID=28038 RepID=UPI000FECDE8D|nr:recombinase family protein [Latilactobacillus curvatus]QAR35207.1 recombinase family protein [Latilactobacillus curvatus]
MKYGYVRVSSPKQWEDGTFKEQIEQLKEEGVKDENIYSEQFTGSKREGRQKLSEVIEHLKKDDTLVVVKLDRLARSAGDALKIADEITNLKQARLHILNFGLFDNSATGKLLFTVMSAFAEFELNLITDRLQSGREYKRRNDATYRDGRKRKMNHENIEDAIAKLNSGWTYKEVAKFNHVSERTLYYRVKESKMISNK